MTPLSRRALFTRVRAMTDPGETRADATWLRVHRTAMACRVEVVLPGEDARFLQAAREALDEADRLEAMLSVFRETSDLSRVNREAAWQPVAVPAELFTVVRRGKELHQETDGAFDISSTPYSRCWGFMRRTGRLPEPAEIDAARSCVGMHRVALDATTRSVVFTQAGVELNLGAIGKGYVLDRMAHTLRELGVGRALISAGRSSVVAIGGARREWSVELRSLVRDEILGRLHLRDGALGTSGAGEQFFEVNGVRYGHVIDPRTGWPSSGTRAASVVTSTGADADALSTAFLVGGIEVARRYCETHANVLAVITPEEGRPQVFGSYRGVSVMLA
jgi:thiamine biosynthesis lipoprotein